MQNSAQDQSAPSPAKLSFGAPLRRTQRQGSEKKLEQFLFATKNRCSKTLFNALDNEDVKILGSVIEKPWLLVSPSEPELKPEFSEHELQAWAASTRCKPLLFPTLPSIAMFPTTAMFPSEILNFAIRCSFLASTVTCQSTQSAELKIDFSWCCQNVYRFDQTKSTSETAGGYPKNFIAKKYFTSSIWTPKLFYDELKGRQIAFQNLLESSINFSSSKCLDLKRSLNYLSEKDSPCIKALTVNKHINMKFNICWSEGKSSVLWCEM